MIKIFKKSNKEKPAKTFPEVFTRESRRHLWLSGSRSLVISLVVISSLVYTFLKDAPEKIGEHIAVVAISGAVVTGDKETDGWVLSKAIKTAMEDDNAKVLLLDLESPGGSPNDAEHVHQTIMDYRKRSTKPIYATIRGMCASACYYIASAADVIYAHDSSLVGSIGVRMEAWQLSKALAKFDLDKQILTAGEHKALMDPFVEMSAYEKGFIQENMLDKLHGQNISAVKEGRGDKLVDDPILFSGLIWTGTDAVELGLVDQIKTPTQIMDIIEDQYNVTAQVQYGKQKFKISSLFSLDAEDVISSIAKGVAEVMMKHENKPVM